jgi:hypothetical protein
MPYIYIYVYIYIYQKSAMIVVEIFEKTCLKYHEYKAIKR